MRKSPFCLSLVSALLLPYAALGGGQGEDCDAYIGAIGSGMPLVPAVEDFTNFPCGTTEFMGATGDDIEELVCKFFPRDRAACGVEVGVASFGPVRSDSLTTPFAMLKTTILQGGRAQKVSSEVVGARVYSAFNVPSRS